jgi:DNA invertase Pin-like site-specific DNA recombinase
MAFINTGDTLVVPPLDRLSRSLKDPVNHVAARAGQEIGFMSENLDTTTPGGRLVFHLFAALAEFVREVIVQNTNEGLAAARARGRTGGRPTVVHADLLRQARGPLPNPANGTAWTPSPS